MSADSRNLPAAASPSPAPVALHLPTLTALLDAMAQDGWNVCIYFPQERRIRVPKSVADRLHCARDRRLDDGSAVPAFIGEPNAERYLSLFDRIDRGETFVSASFDSYVEAGGFTVTLALCTRRETGEPTAAIGRVLPSRVENAHRDNRARNFLEARSQMPTDPSAVFTQGISSLFYAVYVLNLPTNSFVCYREHFSDTRAELGLCGTGSEAWLRYIDTWIEPEDRAELRAFTDLKTLDARLADTDILALRYRRKEVGWVRGSIIAVNRNEDGHVTDVVFTVENIAREMELRHKAELAQQEARLDPLTRTCTRKVFDELLAHPDDRPSDIGLMLVDVDCFKEINDSFGHETGDRVLIAVSELLRTVFRDSDAVIRMGSDEFAVVIDYPSRIDWTVLCKKLQNIAAGLQGLLPGGRPVTLSCGAARTVAGFTADLYTRADKALCHTKTVGRAGCTLMTADGRIDHCWRDPYAALAPCVSDTALVQTSMKTMLANTDGYAFIKDRNLVYVACSEAFARHVAQKPDTASVIGHTDLEIIPDAALAEKYRHEDLQMFQSGETRLTVREKTPSVNGRACWSQTTKYLLRDDDGRPAGILGICTDITHQVEVENAAVSGLNAALYEALPGLFTTLLSVNLTTGLFTPVQAPEHVQALMPDNRSFDAFVTAYCHALVDPAFTDAVHDFADLSTLPVRLADNGQADREFRKRNHTHWFRMSFITAAAAATGTDGEVFFTVNRIDAEAAKINEELFARKVLLETIFENMPGGLTLFRWDGTDLTALYISPEFGRLYGRSLKNEAGVTDFSLVHPTDRAAYKATFENALRNNAGLEYTFRVWNAPAEAYIWVNMHAVVRPQADGTKLVYANYSDVTAQMAQEQAWQFASEHDPLTGLYNRGKVFDECRRLLFQYPNEQWAMMHFDISQFRLYNAFFGEKAGDMLLIYIAQLFRRMDEEFGDWAYGRIDADVFCLFYPLHESSHQRQLFGLLTGLESYRDDFLVEPRIGIYRVTDRQMPIETMFARATIAAKALVAGSGENIRYFDAEMESAVANTQAVTNEMQTALEDGQFHVWLQPKISLETGKVTSAEALVRWQHPLKGLVSPDTFIPVFERNGFITRLDRYMWERVAQIQSQRLKRGDTIIPISVNVSRISMYDPGTVLYLKQLVERYELDPQYLELELTESAYMDDPVEMEKSLAELQAFGFRVLIDDFGKGYSSLHTLRTLRADKLKLDMAFLPNTRDDVRGCAVVSAVINMARHLGMAVIAEGVETEEQAAMLRAEGCPYAQGFHFARPMPVSEFKGYLAAHS